ncbi:MAG: hypothetical protein HZB38_01830, partial [Planctomycetes bacterium]|nr:hypothetical protein [Planctomycetota bacterium]
LALLLLACMAGSIFAQAPNDDCTNPLQISGNGTFTFDLSQAVYDIPILDNCAGRTIDLSRDLWYCWTASCNGMVTITTCGQTTADTVIAFYDGCACPVAGIAPVCCNDDTNDPVCGVQSTITCEVLCGHQYMIRLGEKDFSGGPGGSGAFTISCNGAPCDPQGCPPGECCGGTPHFVGSSGPVSVTTTFTPGLNQPVVQVVDLANDGSAPLGSWWSTAPFFAGPAAWNRATLGTVFGVAVDGTGNIYVAHTSVYASGFVGPFFADSPGIGGPGAIYKINTNTGAVSVLTSLANSADPAIVAFGGSYVDEAYPGIGNITANCQTDNLYASNFEDGRIYRIPLAGSPANGSTYDHATDTIATGIAPETGDAPGFVRLGERVWAVETHQGRLYYSVYGSDTFRSVAPNTVWSIQLDATGNFVPNTRRQENLGGVPASCPNPFSDMSFTASGSMLLAQRSMGDPDPVLADTRSWAHQSCLLEYVCDPVAEGNWQPSPNSFDIGYVTSGSVGPSAAGGVDADYRTGGRVWATGDALIANPSGQPWIYGLQGIPPTGNTDPFTSILIDLDNDVTFHDKSQIGSVEISCPSACAEVEPVSVLCAPPSGDGGQPCYDYTFTIRNLTGQTVQYILIPSSAVTPNVIGPLAPGTFDPGDTLTITVRICAPANTTFILPLTLMDTDNQECCHIEPTVDLPECTCFQFLDGPTVVGLGGGQYTISFTFQPMEFNVGHIFFDWEPIGNPTYTVTVNPTYMPVNVPQWGSQTFTATFTVNPNGGAMPTSICFRMFIHRPDLWICCSELICVNLVGGNTTCEGDVNNDGVVDLTDLTTLLSNYGMGSGATSANGDMDADGDVDLTDLTLLLSAFGTQCW